MSETPKRILFITMKLSAAELEKAKSVAFMVSEPSCYTYKGYFKFYLQFLSF